MNILKCKECYGNYNLEYKGKLIVFRDGDQKTENLYFCHSCNKIVSVTSDYIVDYIRSIGPYGGPYVGVDGIDFNFEPAANNNSNNPNNLEQISSTLNLIKTNLENNSFDIDNRLNNIYTVIFELVNIIKQEKEERKTFGILGSSNFNLR